MITPGFFSFFNTHRALMTSQNALNVVNQNISNANTEGYSRQRAEISAYDPYQAPSLHAFTNGQMGQGSIVTKIERLRDSFLDAQFRNESSTLGFNEVKSQILQQIEGILAEPSDSGISAAMERFFQAAHELSLNPESIPVRQDYLQTAADFVTVVQQIGSQLDDLRTNLVGKPGQVGTFENSQAHLVTTQVNEYLATIAGINQQILTVSASEAQPNDLLDKRDLLLDQLSELVDITVAHRNNGLVDIYIGEHLEDGTSDGLLMVQGIEQIDSLEYVANNFETGATNGQGYNDPYPYDIPGFLQSVNQGIRLNEGFRNPPASPKGIEITSGKLHAILEMGRGGDTASAPGLVSPTGVTVRSVFEDIDRFMDNFGFQVNTIQTGGIRLDGLYASGNPIFNEPGAFLPPAAGPATFNGPESRKLLDWNINTSLLQNPDDVAAAIDDDTGTAAPDFAGVGDGRNAIEMLQLRDRVIAALENTTFSNFVNGITSEVGIQSRTFQDREISQTGVVGSLDLQRESVSGVNIDEEMIDMLRYQRSFEASSKVMATLDDIMQTIINMT